MVLALVLVAGLIALGWYTQLEVGRTVSGHPGAPATAGPVPATAGSAPASPLPGASPTPSVVHSGLGTFAVASGTGPVVGTGGSLLRYRVAVEKGLGIDAAGFAADVDAILADPRGWTSGGDVRFQRVSSGQAVDFTVYLASPVTSDEICAQGGLDTAEFTNCRLSPGRVVINSARWLTAVPGYGAPLSVYRAYAINHEVGHQLGYQHELCPGRGRPAPVMQQQTLGLHGCVANAWPYRNGVRYSGPPSPE